MAFTQTTVPARLADGYGSKMEFQIGVTPLAAGVATITVPGLSRIEGAIAQMQSTTSYIVSVTATANTTPPTFSVIAEATSGGGAAAITLSVSWIAWGDARM